MERGVPWRADKMKRRILRTMGPFVFGACLIWFVSFPTRADLIGSQALILTPQPNPGHPGQTLNYILWSTIDPNGHIAFTAELHPFGSLNHGAYLWSAGGPEPLARTGELAPGGGPDGVFSYFYATIPVVT